MNPRLNPRELEMLSAYVDGALDARQASDLETRLKAEPALAQALDQLKATRTLLRRAPQRKAPRNFTLTRQMASQLQLARGHQRGFSYGFASAAAAALLVFVTAGDLLAGGQLFLPAAPAESMLLMSESAPANEAPMDLPMPEEAMGGAVEDGAQDQYADPYAEAYTEAYTAEEDFSTKRSAEPLGAQELFLIYARTIEVVLLVIAILAGLVAWQRRKEAR
jgi:hypothetical protein